MSEIDHDAAVRFAIKLADKLDKIIGSRDVAKVDELRYVAALADQAKRLAEALEYWLPKSMPFPDARRDSICESHNIQWEEAHAALASYREKVR